MPLRRLRFRLPLLAAALSAATLLAFPASAKVPLALTQQGRLFDDHGTPITGPVTITFAFYDGDAGGAPLWKETQNIQLDEGYFSARLGEANAFEPAQLFDGSSRFLGIAVNGDAEMAPRQEVGSVPYALVAGDVTGDIHPTSVTINGVTIIDASGAWVGGSAPAGPVGATGAAGPMGPVGPTGADGMRGVMGPTGAMGPAGPAGGIGPQGAAGPAGATGSVGAQGPIGPAGAVGPAGTVGPTGAMGPPGPAGAQGAAGAKGATGATGAIGATGPQGPGATHATAVYACPSDNCPVGLCGQPSGCLGQISTTSTCTSYGGGTLSCTFAGYLVQ